MTHLDARAPPPKGQAVYVESPRLGSLLQPWLALGAVLVFYTGLDNYLFALGGPKPKDMVLVFATAVALALALDPDRPRTLLRSPLFLWLLFYFGITVAWAPFMKGYSDAWQVLYDRCRSIVTLISFALIFDDARARRTAILAVTACIVLASWLNVAELLSLLQFEAGPERIPGRSSGFYLNANDSAVAITLGLALVVENIPTSWRTPLLLVCVIGVGATFSRGGAVCLALVILWMAQRKIVRPRAMLLAIVLGAVLLAYAVDFLASHDLLTENTASRLRLEGDDSGRFQLARQAWDLFLGSPLVGGGLGATRIWGVGAYPHNMFLALAAEQGVLGLIAFPALGVALLLGNRKAVGFVVVLMAFGLFGHTLLEGRHSLLLMALAAWPGAALVEPESPLAGHGAVPG